MADFNYDEIKENLKNEEQQRKEAEKKNAKALKQISKIEKIEAQLRKEQERLREIIWEGHPMGGLEEKLKELVK